jgi:protease PrsW
MEILTGILLSLFFGFVPMLVFAYIIYWLDRYEKEPKLLLLGVFTWGAVVAAGAAFFINTALGMGVYLFTESEFATEFTTSTIFAPVVEEFLKGAAVLAVFLIFRHEFDSILDGIVYAAITALGFAATENSYYILTYGYLEEGFSGLFRLAFVRVILVGWQHPFYSAFFGIGLAVARLYRSSLVKITAPLASLTLSIFTHSFHNTMAGMIGGGFGFAATLMVDWSGWLFMFLFILWALYREQMYLVTHLREEVALGVLSSQQYSTACSAWSQTYARLTSMFTGRYSQTRRFYRLAGELAHKKHQHSTLGEEAGNTAVIARLRAELSDLSRRVGA